MKRPPLLPLRCAVLPALLLLSAALPAIAQVPDPSDVRVYHSFDSEGELPDPQYAPGCTAPPTDEEGEPLGTGCIIRGGFADELELWVFGGSNVGGTGEVICQLGPGGGTGEQICGADIVLQLTGIGEFVSFVRDDAMGSLVHNPVCDDGEGGSIGQEGCFLPFGTKQIRMNFRRGDSDPPAQPRRLGKLVVDTNGKPPQNVTFVTAFGSAAGANLQLLSLGTPAVPQVVATSDPTDVPEPGQLLQLAVGLVGLQGLRRRRLRRSRR